MLKDLAPEGCDVDLVCGDVAKVEDVRNAFKSATIPVGGIIQDAMVLPTILVCMCRPILVGRTV